MWAIFKTLKYGFWGFTMYDYMGKRVNPHSDRLWCTGNSVFPVTFIINNFSGTEKIMNHNPDLREVPQRFLTELLPTLPFCLIEIHSFIIEL